MGGAVMALARAGSAERVCLCASLPNSVFSGLVLVACSLPPADGCIHTEFTPRKTAGRCYKPGFLPPPAAFSLSPRAGC